MEKNNIIFEKVWEDNNLLELKINAISEYVNAYQYCYIEDKLLHQIGEEITQYSFNYYHECYVEFGKKEGNYTPAFSMRFLPADNSGHVQIEVDVEINDNDVRAHRCCFYISGELGLLEGLGKNLQHLANGTVGEIYSLRPMK